jgi:UDP-glucuronate 4-epimerase
MKILVTGTAGFIGFHLASLLLERGDEVVGLDIINDYYDVNLKHDRLRKHGIEVEKIQENILSRSMKHPNYRFIKMDLTNGKGINSLFESERFDRVCHLAAQAGVRYSLTNPKAYIESNYIGFFNIIEACRAYGCQHLTYASSSSVYGLNEKMPFSVHDDVSHPLSIYAASKKANELLAHSYSYLFGIPTTGLRFFSVYGPWGRPDMALFLFTKAIIEGKPIQVFNHGKMWRDFTYVDDIVGGVARVIDKAPIPNDKWDRKTADPASSEAPFRVYNIGRGEPVRLLDFIDELEKQLGRTAIKEFLPMQPADIASTSADVTDLERDFNYRPSTTVEHGIKEFVAWYTQYYHL